MTRAVAAVVVALGLWGACAAGTAAEELPSPIGGQDRVDQLMGRYNLHPAFDKLGRGVSNALLGWLEIPLNVHKRYSASDTVGSGLAGAAIGLFKGVVRMGVGVYETATFFLPYPEHFAPILPTLEYFRKTGRRGPLPLE